MEAAEQEIYDVIPSLALCSSLLVFASSASLLLIAFKEDGSTSSSSSSSRSSRSDAPGDGGLALPWKPRASPLLARPCFLLAFRSVVFIYCSAILIYDVYTYGFDVFYFYTQWSFLLLIIYFGLATISSAQGMLRTGSSSINAFHGSIQGLLKDFYRQDIENKGDSVAILQLYSETVLFDAEYQAPSSFKLLLEIIFQILGGAILLTDFVYWLGIFPLLKDIPRSYDFLQITVHGMNAVFFLAEAIFNQMKFPWFRGAYFVLYSCSYVLFQWLMHAQGLVQWWPYPFLDPSQRYAPLWYLILAIANLVCYGLVCGISHINRRICSCFSP